MSATASFLLLNGHDLFSAKFLILRYGLMLFEGIRQELWKKSSIFIAQGLWVAIFPEKLPGMSFKSPKKCGFDDGNHDKKS